ncbi:MAG: tetratricopeptide repeat protein [Proteobacteria bacterium]|nr:MAG: tetratricopeptide repeat protein [Pseudomonadota bacterium]
MEDCPENPNGKPNSAPNSLGSIQGWKIEILDQSDDPSGRWQELILFRVSRSKGHQTVCQYVSISAISESAKPEVMLEKDSLVIRQTTYDRYSPDSWVSTTIYRLDKVGRFEISSHADVKPFDEFKKRFESALKGTDLNALLILRNEYVSKLSGGYNSGFFNSERRSLCFRSLEVATNLASKDIAGSKSVFIRFFNEATDDEGSPDSCAKTYDPPAYLTIAAEGEPSEGVAEDGEDAAQKLTEECDSSMWEDCTPLSHGEILILNNAAFLLQKIGQHAKAIELLRDVLKQDPKRKVAYKNLGDSLAAQNKSGSLLALLAPDVLKRNRKSLSSAESQSVAKRTGATCEPKESLISTISERGNLIEFEFRCKPTGASEKEGRLRAKWNVTLDDVLVIKTLAEKKASKACPVSQIAKIKQTKAWTETNDSYFGRLPGRARNVAESCYDVVGYKQFGDCKWLIACRGGLNRANYSDNRFHAGTIIDFVVADEYDESTNMISRATGSRTQLTPIDKGVQIEESVRIGPDKTQSSDQFLTIGSFNLTCNGETCAESVYRCDVSEHLKALPIELRPVSVNRGSAPIFDKYDVKLTTFFSTKNEAPLFEPGQLMSRRGYFDRGFSEELWDAGLMRKRRLSCDKR